MELTQIAHSILRERYLDEGEQPEDRFRLIAKTVAQGETIREDQILAEQKFYDIISQLRFIPNSPTIANIKREKGCLSACFVMSPDDNLESIMQVCNDAAMTEKWGGGIGFGLGRLRPRGASIQSVHGVACGPINVMRIYARVGDVLTQGSFRLGAHMAQMPVTHPDIFEFIRCKEEGEFSNFNISVQVSDSFMEAVRTKAMWSLYDPRYRVKVSEVRATDIWNAICESAWRTGDPGLVFIDRVHETAPNPSLGEILSSNPCGEEFLEDYGNCCLGSISLSAHLKSEGLDYSLLRETVELGVRFLDDVTNINKFPIPKQAEVNRLTRRIGLGVMGWADTLDYMGIVYGSEESLDLAQEVGSLMKEWAIEASKKLAVERGSYPLDSGEGMRNSSVTTIAPTGTISRLAGCSSGIEPQYGLAWESNILWTDDETSRLSTVDAPLYLRERMTDAQLRTLLDTNPNGRRDYLRSIGLEADHLVTAHEIEPMAHVLMQAAWQESYATNSVSKTVNLEENATIQDVGEVYQIAWETGCKATTVYRDGSKSQQVLYSSSPKQVEESGAVKELPKVMDAQRHTIATGHGNLHVNVSLEAGRPAEIFLNHGKSGRCQAANTEALARVVSIALSSGVPVDELGYTLKGITCCPSFDQGKMIRSIPDALAQVLLGDEIDISTDTSGDCVKCGGDTIAENGCHTCRSCGYSICD